MLEIKFLKSVVNLTLRYRSKNALSGRNIGSKSKLACSVIGSVMSQFGHMERISAIGLAKIVINATVNEYNTERKVKIRLNRQCKQLLIAEDDWL